MGYFKLVRLALSKLQLRRPIFHSEADFQHELAMELRDLETDLRLRLEYPVLGGAIDMMVLDGENRPCFAIELKYLKAHLKFSFQGEHFSLVNHSARDLRAYDVWKDVSRIERSDISGMVIVITNDRGYLSEPRKNSGFYEFRLTASRKIPEDVELKWLDPTRSWLKDRAQPLTISGRYMLDWREYSKVGDDANASFKVLIFDIARCRLEAINEIIDRAASLPVLDNRTADEIIGYDENGLPN